MWVEARERENTPSLSGTQRRALLELSGIRRRSHVRQSDLYWLNKYGLLEMVSDGTVKVTATGILVARLLREAANNTK